VTEQTPPAAGSKKRRNDFLTDGGICPECAGVVVGYSDGYKPRWLCLDCRATWGLSVSLAADLTKKGFPVDEAPR